MSEINDDTYFEYIRKVGADGNHVIVPEVRQRQYVATEKTLIINEVIEYMRKVGFIPECCTESSIREHLRHSDIWGSEPDYIPFDPEDNMRKVLE